LGSFPPYRIFRYLKVKYTVLGRPLTRAAMPKSIHRPEYDVLRSQLRKLREDAGVTQTELSMSLKRSQSFISDIERGVRRLDILELRDVCERLGTSFLAFVASFDEAVASTSKKVTLVKRRNDRRT
jgi:ribosome-binding protein aMBF1 (putative translation factor)